LQGLSDIPGLFAALLFFPNPAGITRKSSQDKKILDYARNNLGDFDQFLKTIVKYLGIQP